MPSSYTSEAMKALTTGNGRRSEENQWRQPRQSRLNELARQLEQLELSDAAVPIIREVFELAHKDRAI